MTREPNKRGGLRPDEPWPECYRYGWGNAATPLNEQAVRAYEGRGSRGVCGMRCDQWDQWVRLITKENNKFWDDYFDELDEHPMSEQEEAERWANYWNPQLKAMFERHQSMRPKGDDPYEKHLQWVKAVREGPRSSSM